MKAQMKDGTEEIVSVCVCDRLNVIWVLKIDSVHASVQLCEEMRVNFATAQNIVGVARDAAGMIIAHPLQEVRIVSASFKATGVPGPKAFALSAEHLVASLGLVNGNLAIWAGFSVVFQEIDGSDRVRVANVEGVIAFSLNVPANRASEFVACCALPSGRDEAVAAGMSAAVNEFSISLLRMLRGVMLHQCAFGL